MTTEGESPKEPERLPLLAAAVPLGVVVAALVGGLVVFAGWRYTTEYYKQFGIEPSGLDFSPYDYALRSWPIVVQMVGLMIAIPLLAATIHLYVRLILLRMPRPWQINEAAKNLVGWLLLAATISGVVCIVLGLFDRNPVLESIGFALMAFGGSLLMALWGTGKLHLVGMIYLGLLLFLFAVVTVGADNLGGVDAERDRENLNRFPRISIVTESELGLEHQDEVAGLPVYGSYRLILHNGGMYYLVSEDAPDETIAVPEDAVVHLKLQKGQ